MDKEDKPTGETPPTSSVTDAPRTPGTRGKRQIGFALPTLHIPPPNAEFTPDSNYPYSANTANLNSAISSVPSDNPYMYHRKASQYMFHGLKDFTKSGLGMGEKISFWLYNKFSSLSRNWFTHIFLSIVIILYTVGGAAMFVAIEGVHEEKLIEGDIRKERYILIRKLQGLALTKPQLTSIGEWEGEASQLLMDFESYVINAYKNHSLIVGNRGDKVWTFWNSMVYCSTIYTTIGYGHMFPTTTTGQALTIVYSIIGIPLFLIILTDFGKLFTRCIKFLWSFVRRVYYTGSCRKVRKTAGVKDIMKGAQMMYEIATFRRPSMFVDPEAIPPDDNNEKIGDSTVAEDTNTNTNTPTTPAPSNFEIDEEFNLPISVAMFLLVAYIFSGAVIYCYWEDWNFFSSFYFVFISMSTIGFGDYVPRHPICMIVSIIYLVFGLALMSMCINVVQAKLSDTFKQASAKIGATIGIKVSEEDGSITTIPPQSVEIPDIHLTPSVKE